MCDDFLIGAIRTNIEQLHTNQKLLGNEIVTPPNWSTLALDWLATRRGDDEFYIKYPWHFVVDNNNVRI